MKTHRIFLATIILMLALIAELTVGFRLNEGAGGLAELGMAAALVVASVLIFAPMGRSRRLVAALAAFSTVLVLWAFNSALTTSLDVKFGGPYGWSGTRTMILTVLVGPVVASAGAAFTFACAHLARFQRAR